MSPLVAFLPLWHSTTIIVSCLFSGYPEDTGYPASLIYSYGHTVPNNPIEDHDARRLG